MTVADIMESVMLWLCDAPVCPTGPEVGYVESPCDGSDTPIPYESCSDGTGGVSVSAFGMVITHCVDDPEAVGRGLLSYALAPPRSDRAELAGLIAQLRNAPRSGVIRLVSDACSASAAWHDGPAPSFPRESDALELVVGPDPACPAVAARHRGSWPGLAALHRRPRPPGRVGA